MDECYRVYKSRDDAKRAILCNVTSTAAFVHLAELFTLCGTGIRSALKVMAFCIFITFFLVVFYSMKC